MHNMDKNAEVIIIYSLNAAWENNSLSEAHNTGLNFQDILPPW